MEAIIRGLKEAGPGFAATGVRVESSHYGVLISLRLVKVDVEPPLPQCDEHQWMGHSGLPCPECVAEGVALGGEPRAARPTHLRTQRFCPVKASWFVTWVRAGVY